MYQLLNLVCTGLRLSNLFIGMYNDARVAFEVDVLKEELADFSPLLQAELKRRRVQRPPLTYNSQVSSERPKAHLTVSPLSEILVFTKGVHNDQVICMHINDNLSIEQLLDILKSSKEYGTHTNLPTNNGMVPIINVTNLSDESLVLLLSVFVDVPTDFIPNRDDILNHLMKYVPYAKVQQRAATASQLSNCATCKLAFSLFTWAHYTCYYCRRLLCKNCPVNVILTPQLADVPRPLCSDCLACFNQQDTDNWTKKSEEFIEIGTLEAVKAALGCLTIALCLSDFSTKPVIRVAQAFLHKGMPELSISFVSSVLDHSEDPKEILRMYILSAQIFKVLACNPSHSSETKWNLLLAAKESCNLALEIVSRLDTVEIPTLVSIQKEIDTLLNSLKENQELVQECEIKMICSQMETYWQKRDWQQLLELIIDGTKANVSFLPHVEDKMVIALEHFIASKKNYMDKMSPDDHYGLMFLQVLFNIQKDRFSNALCDLEKLAYHSHYHMWLNTGIADLLLGLLTDKYNLLFPNDSLEKVLEGELVIDDCYSDDADYNQNRFSLLIPKKSELTPPFTSQWPELGVEGLNTKGHTKFEKAVALLLEEGRWNEWDAAMAYINYVPACIHPAEAALCFSYAAMLLLKRLRECLGSLTSPPLSEVFATKNMIMNCLQSSMALCIRFLHPGMQFYVCRLCLGTALQTMKLTGSLAIHYEAEVVTTLLHLTMYSSRFCPAWHFPSIPLSEAALLSIKSARYHLKFLFGLQYVPDDKRPVSLSEMLYQIHENDIRGICHLEDSVGARARAMEEMLRDKGWTWNDVVDLMTSPLSPRDSEGWLIQQKSLGVSMPFAKLTGFVINSNADSPSIEIVAIPADPSNGLVGLFSMDDVQTVLQLASLDAYPIFFSLDPPNLHQKRHPFQQWRYKPKELQNSLFLHTLFEADYLLKFFSAGVEVSAKPPFESRPCKVGLTKNLPFDLVEAIKPVAERGGISSQHVHRFWIQGDIVEFKVTEMGPRLEFDLGEPKMHIRSHPIIPGPNGEYCDTEFEDDPNSPEAKFASDISSRYNELGIYFPMFARLRELAKLQALVPILGIFMKNLKDKADGKGLHVPDLLLTEIQQDKHQYHQDKTEDLLRRLDADIGTWPAAGDQKWISSRVEDIRNSLPIHEQRQASFSDIEALAKSTLQEEDERVLNEVTEIFVEICGHRLSKDDLKISVKQWLALRNSFSATELRDLVCSVLPLPSKEDIINKIIQPHHQRVHSAFKQKLDSITSPLNPILENSCKWVPAAAVKDETGLLMGYGGVMMPFRLLVHDPLSDSKQSQVPTLFEILKRRFCSKFQVESIPAHTHEDIPTPPRVLFTAPEGLSIPASNSKPAEKDNESSSAEGSTNSTTSRSEQEKDASTEATDNPSDQGPNSCQEDASHTSNNEASSYTTAQADKTDEHTSKFNSTESSTDSFPSSTTTCNCDEECTHMGSSLGASHYVDPQFKTKSDYVHKSGVNPSDPNDNSDEATGYNSASDSNSEINESDIRVQHHEHHVDVDSDIISSVHSATFDSDSNSEFSENHEDTTSNSQSISRSGTGSTTQPDPNGKDQKNYSGYEGSEINSNVQLDSSSNVVQDVNLVTCESTLQWRHPGYGMKALCTGETIREKAANPVKMVHPCALYTKLRHNCTHQKYKELLSIEKDGRQHVKRIFENFNISHNITIHATPASTALNEKVDGRCSAFLATIGKHQEWITHATKTHPGTTKANDVIKEANRLASANNRCMREGCECCRVMAQSNVCSDDDGYQCYRAELSKEVNCQSSNIVYVIRCRRSGKNIFIGQTKEELHECLRQHRTRKHSTVYEHFTSEGYSFDDMEVVILADIDDNKVREEKTEEWREKLTKSGRKHQRKEGTK